MKFHASSCFAVLLSLAIGCADDGKSEDDVGDETDGSSSEDTSSSENGSTESSSTESSSTDTGESTDADTDSTSESTADTSESTDADTSETTDDTTESTNDTSEDTGEPIMCPDGFPEFDKSCTDDADCALVIHTTDCCGNSVAWGLGVGEVEAFDAAEAICDSQYPICDCPQGPTIAEDGNEGWEPADFAVDCMMGSCMSYVPG